MQGETKRFFSFSYYVRPEKDRKLRMHQMRDGQAFAEIAAVLNQQGYEYGGLLMNHPKVASALTTTDGKDLLAKQGITPSDLIVLAARPPLDDVPGEKNKRHIERSGSPLETLIFSTVRRHFDTCSREFIKLSQEMARRLPQKDCCKAEIQFSTKREATYNQYRVHDQIHGATRWYMRLPEEEFTTAAYLLYTPLYDGGPGLLVSFGLGGPENLFWNHLVRIKCPDILASPRFVMAEITMQPQPDYALTLDFTEQWAIRFLLNG